MMNSKSLDLYLLPFAREAGKDQPELAGLHAAHPPRRTARSRDADRLVLYLQLTGNAPLTPGKLDQILERLAQTYYKTSGSVTYAMRNVAEELNQYLLDRNLKSASSGLQAVGLLSLCVLRGEQVYLAQSGPVYAYLVTGGQARRYYDPQLSGRGLGLSRTTPLRYIQAQLQPFDYLLLATQPSSTWSEATLLGVAGPKLETLRRRLLNRMDTDLNAVLIQARSGGGSLHLLRIKAQTEGEAVISEQSGKPVQEIQAPLELPATEAAPGAEQRPEPGVVEREPEAAEGPPAVVESQPEAAESQPAVAESQPAVAEGQPEAAEIRPEAVLESEPPLPQVKVQPQQAAEMAAALAEDEFEPLPEAEEEPDGPTGEQTGPTAAAVDEQSAKSPRGGAASRRAAGRARPSARPARQGLPTAWSSFLQGLRRTLQRALPGEALFTIPGPTMAFIAVAVPLVLVAVAGVVYVQRGRASEFEKLYTQASQIAQQAPQQVDTNTRRMAWEAVLGYLDQAETYGRTSQAEQLREQARAALDELELVRRVDYRPAIIGGLQDNMLVTRLLTVDDDLYMLDANSGNVLRGRVTNSLDYEIDRSFQCGPGSPGGFPMGPIIDIVPAPPGNVSGAVVLGLQASGSVVYCSTGEGPQIVPLARPATAPNWGSLVGFTIDPDQNNLFVLDPLDKAVWVYWGSSFEQEPELFFGDEIPPMQDVVDLAVDKRDLYLLHSNGAMTLCTYSNLNVSPTRCENQVDYVDSRPGETDQKFTPPAPFKQVLTTQPPDPSLNLLEPQSHAIYQFSLRTLSYYRRFMPASDLVSGPATAFYVNQLQRLIFLAVGHNIYQASIP